MPARSLVPIVVVAGRFGMSMMLPTMLVMVPMCIVSRLIMVVITMMLITVSVLFGVSMVLTMVMSRCHLETSRGEQSCDADHKESHHEFRAVLWPSRKECENRKPDREQHQAPLHGRVRKETHAECGKRSRCQRAHHTMHSTQAAHRNADPVHALTRLPDQGHEVLIIKR